MVNYGFLSTYPPTRCGLATFSAALLRNLEDPSVGEHCGLVRVVDAPSKNAHGDADMDVDVELVNDTPASVPRAVEALNRYDVVIVQHQFGVFGGQDGEDVLTVLAGIDIPVITVLHTVPPEATAHRHQVLQRVIDASCAVVALSRTDAITLLDTYRVDAARVTVIPHGAATGGAAPALTPGGASPTILTWGLLGPGKGIEWAIASLGRLRDLRPAVRYLVAGQTHPSVLAAHGESYRSYLHRQAVRFGVAGMVEFDPAYRTASALSAWVHGADVVLLPYDSPLQTTSGVLVEAVAAGRPVVATNFPHARELLAGGAGLLVPRRDPSAMAHAVRRVLTEPGLAGALSDRCASIAPELEWSVVADRYRALAGALVLADATRRVAT